MSRESKILIGILVLVVGGLIGLFAIANRNETANTPTGDKTKIVRDTSHKTGSGQIQLVEFGDYQCPGCGSAYPNLKQLLKDFDGKITFYFRNFPITSAHPNAMAAANAAEAAADQGKFWEMHDRLYETQDGSDSWTKQPDPTDKLVAYAKDLGLDVEKFKQALANKQFQSVIDQDVADATALSIEATPTLYFNGVKYSGATNYPALRDQVGKLLNQTQK